jgi:hypothetical protein
MSGDITGDLSFAALPRSMRRRIDQAFNSATKEDKPSLAESDSNGHGLRGSVVKPEMGGFILDSEQGGGFIPDEPGGGFVTGDIDMRKHERDSSPDDDDAHIPLAAIPTALQILDLPPDDEQVLAVFKNAASGWNDLRSARSSRDNVDITEVVSRRDWRAVCAILVVPQQVANEEAEDSDEVMDSGEEYVGSDEDEHDSISGENDLEDEDYSETQKKTKSRRGRSRKTLDEDLPSIRTVTARQKDASRAAFALFFPDVSESQLDVQRITISDLIRVSKELKEKLTFDQVGLVPPCLVPFCERPHR